MIRPPFTDSEITERAQRAYEALVEQFQNHWPEDPADLGGSPFVEALPWDECDPALQDAFKEAVKAALTPL